MFERFRRYGVVRSAKLLLWELITKVFLHPTKLSFSQHGEDWLIDLLLHGKKSGTYVDVGAFDPDFLSNTKKFYLRGWRGINIEPNPKRFKSFEQKRPGDTNLNLAVSNNKVKLKLLKLSGQESLVAEELGVHGKTVIEEVYEVPVETLAKILEQNLNDRSLDFLSVDTEGYDIEVLKSNDWERFRPKVICVESLNLSDLDYENDQKNFLGSIGYRRVYDNGLNSFYIDVNNSLTRERVYTEFNQYKADIFYKLGIDFEKGESILDVGAGGCTDAKIFRDIFGLNVLATDIYEHENCRLWDIPFQLLSIFELGRLDSKFDNVFLHDVLHHVDEENQSRESHILALKSLRTVCKSGGRIIIIEANRYNPIFYPHMTKMLGHEHFTQWYFMDIVAEVFPSARFKFFESHRYPTLLLPIFKVYEKFMELLAPRSILSYNVAIIENYEN